MTLFPVFRNNKSSESDTHLCCEVLLIAQQGSPTSPHSENSHMKHTLKPLALTVQGSIVRCHSSPFLDIWIQSLSPPLLCYFHENPKRDTNVSG